MQLGGQTYLRTHRSCHSKLLYSVYRLSTLKGVSILSGILQGPFAEPLGAQNLQDLTLDGVETSIADLQRLCLQLTSLTELALAECQGESSPRTLCWGRQRV